MTKVVEVDALTAWVAANQRDEYVAPPPPLSPPPAPDPQPNVPGASGWVLRFRDEFNDLSISNSIPYDGSRWYTETEPSNMPGGSPNHRVYPHVIAPTTVEQANPFSIVDGDGGKVLRMTLRPVNGVWYGSSIATTDRDTNMQGFAIKPPSFWEARLKLPNGLGPWLSFWAKSQERTGPAGVNGMYTQKGEVDILEYWGGAPAYWTNLHDWTKASGQDGVGGNKALAHADFYSAFHDYGMTWTDTAMILYFDGNAVGNIPTPNIMKTLAYYPILTLGMGGGYPYDQTPNPTIMDVSHVRIWGK